MTSELRSQIEMTTNLTKLRHPNSSFVLDGVTLVGYPIGQDTISVTSGIVTRSEVTIDCIRSDILSFFQDGVTVVGYPIGGDTISVTSGVVSRIEVTSYVHGSTELLGVQIDAAINSGQAYICFLQALNQSTSPSVLCFCLPCRSCRIL